MHRTVAVGDIGCVAKLATVVSKISDIARHTQSTSFRDAVGSIDRIAVGHRLESY